jgi:hypothetical protein
MLALLARLAMLCVLRLGPQHLPASPRALGGLLIALFCLQFVVAYLLGAGELVLPRLLLSIGCMLLPVWALLRLVRLPERFIQTATAFAGAGVLFSVALLPAAALLGDPELAKLEPQDVPASQALVAFTALGLTLWKLVVDAHIWSQSLNWPPFSSFALSLSLFFAEVALVSQLFGSAQ